MDEANRIIGLAPCLVCAKPVPLKFSEKSNLAFLNHNGCCQVFARSDAADSKLRGMVIAEKGPVPTEVPPDAPPGPPDPVRTDVRTDDQPAARTHVRTKRTKRAPAAATAAPAVVKDDSWVKW